MFNSQSKIPLILTSIYIGVSILAFILMYATMATETFSAIFVVLVAMPWSIFFTQLINDAGTDSNILNLVVMTIGVVINASIIYVFFSFITRKK